MTTVAYFVFNRPDVTRDSWAAIRAQRPERLLVVADGPRSTHPDDGGLCQEVRDIVSEVDWDCDVKYEFANENLGPRRRVVSGLSVAFDLSNEVIVLEDDCVAAPDFFYFSEALLDRYRSDARVMSITGDNFQGGDIRGDGSYYFSKYFHTWGWASWRRTWNVYDEDLTFWPEFIHTPEWAELMPDEGEKEYWRDIMHAVRVGLIETCWDYQMLACIWRHHGLTATPNVNLVRNIGFGERATHTRGGKRRLSIPTTALGELRHPSTITADIEADSHTFKSHYLSSGLRARLERLSSRVGARWLTNDGPKAGRSSTADDRQ